jgi:hypothetical protein
VDDRPLQPLDGSARSAGQKADGNPQPDGAAPYLLTPSSLPPPPSPVPAHHLRALRVRAIYGLDGFLIRPRAHLLVSIRRQQIFWHNSIKINRLHLRDETSRGLIWFPYMTPALQSLRRGNGDLKIQRSPLPKMCFVMRNLKSEPASSECLHMVTGAGFGASKLPHNLGMGQRVERRRIQECLHGSSHP